MHELLLFVLVIFILCLTLHFQQHYRFKCCATDSDALPPSKPVFGGYGSGSEIETILYDITHNRLCPKLFVAWKEEEFHFFPSSFVYYLLYCITLSTFIIIGTPHSETSTKRASHWIVAYGVLILSSWDSFFSWYRYYSTLYISTYFRHVETMVVFQYFMAYALPYCVSYIIQIHVFYYLFPLVIILHLTFNCFCTWKFACVLIESYMESIDVFSPAIHLKMINNVYFMRRIQLICNILSTVTVTCILTLPASSVSICYIPLIWSVYDIFFTINFVRNNVFVHRKLRNFRRYCVIYYKASCCIRRNNKKMQVSDIPIDIASTVNSAEDINTADASDGMEKKASSHSSMDKETELEAKSNTNNDMMKEAIISQSSVNLNQKHKKHASARCVQSESAPISGNKCAALKINITDTNNLASPIMDAEDDMIHIAAPPSLLTRTGSNPPTLRAFQRSVHILKLQKSLSAPLPMSQDDERSDEEHDVVQLPNIEFDKLSLDTEEEWREKQKMKFKISIKKETIKRGTMTPASPVTPAVEACFDVLTAQGFLDIDLVNNIRKSVKLNQTDFAI